MNNRHIIAANLRQIRRDRQLSQAAVGQQVYLTQSSISKYENAARCPSDDTLVLFSQVYDVDVNSFAANNNAIDYF